MPDTKEAAPSAGGRYTSLCCPDDDKSCFRCCPPIRPRHYDHLDHRLFLKREFRDHTRHLPENLKRARVITGFRCWGLGYLNERHIGCLLHPFQNNGRDLRDRTGYGEKCRRELCREAVTFSGLAIQEAQWILQLTKGLDSFEYSSSKTNPVFPLLRWGPEIIPRLVARYPAGLDIRAYQDVWETPVTDLKPEIYRFPFEICLEEMDLPTLLHADALASLKETISGFISRQRSPLKPPLDNRPFVHQLDIPESLGIFIKYALDQNRLRPSRAREIGAALKTCLKRWASAQGHHE